MSNFYSYIKEKSEEIQSSADLFIKDCIDDVFNIINLSIKRNECDFRIRTKFKESHDDVILDIFNFMIEKGWECKSLFTSDGYILFFKREC